MQPRIADLAMIIREAVESRDESAFHRFAEILVGGLVELERRQQEIQSASQAGSHPDLLVIVEMIKEGFRAQAQRFDELRIYMDSRFEALIISAQEDARRQEKRSDELRADMNARIAEVRADINARNAEVRADMKADREEQAKRSDEFRADVNARIAEVRADVNARSAELRADMNARNAELRADMKADREAQARRDRHRTAIMVSMLSLLFTAIGWLLVRWFANA